MSFEKIKRNNKCFFVLVGFSFLMIACYTPNILAQVVTEYKMFEVKSEPENNMIHELKLGLNAQGDIETIIRSSWETEDVFDVQDLINDEIVINQQSGIDTIVLSCNTCDEFNGGDVTLKYLYNGISNIYHYRHFYLVRTSTDDWEFYTDDDVLVNNLTLRSNLLFGILIGIKQVDVNAY